MSPASRQPAGGRAKLLGSLPFVTRTFEGNFKQSPFVLDMDANLYLGPADGTARDEHSAIEVVYHFLVQTERVELSVRDLLRDRSALLEAFAAFDDARVEDGDDEFRVLVFGTYDGEVLEPVRDDELPAGPCGCSVNAVKRRFYEICSRLDASFEQRVLDDRQRTAEQRFATEPPRRQYSLD
ncbi:MAG: hypothetical protein H6983_24690 [Ectothiorhodospiraceae bacterium]|nr:hypothetical protein [Chromatiales bacterium]MCP5157398.1 hypothetical protein [Ectothiorhodospiraceae bacterium]